MKNKKLICFSVFLVCVLLVLLVDSRSGLWKNADETEYMTITDALNREICVRKNINRIILQASASGGAFMTIAALKGDTFPEYIVGMDDFFRTSRHDFYEYFCEYFPEILDIAEVGTITSGTFSVEQAVALDADVVIIPKHYYETAHNSVEKKLEDANIPVLYLDYHAQNLEQHIVSTRMLGQLLHEEERAEELIIFYEEQVSIVYDRLRNNDLKRPTVYVEVGKFGPNEYFNTFGNYMWGKMVEQAGGINVMHDLKTDTATASSEWVLQKDPDIILIIGSYWSEYPDSMRIGFRVTMEEAMEKLHGYAQRGGWESLSAVKNNRFYSLHHGMIREMYDFVSLQELAKIYYPELFSDIDSEENLKEYFDRFLPVPYSGIWRVSLDE